MKKPLLFLVLFLFVFSFTNLNANNITVTSVSLEGQVVADHYCLVEFNIAWANSWRTTSIPQNWDAAWVFIKFRVAGGEWQHAHLNSAGSVAPSGSTIDFPADTNGVFIYRDSDGTGTFSLSDVQLRWDYGEDGVADDASIEVKVFAIEMVYVPQGNFYVGDGASTFRLFEHADSDIPYLVTDATITIADASGDLGGFQNSLDAGTVVPSTYPIGYEAFYCMKYEMSQEQYVDFLNTLTRDQQDTRTATDVSVDAPTNTYVMSNTATMSSRNGIRCDASGLGTIDPIVFYCDYNGNGTGNETDDGQNIACNWITWMDIAAYADWAGLRPMTECEFEKACRGPNTPVANEYAWGNTSLHNTTYTLINAGWANEYIVDIGLNTGNMSCGDTDGTINGPVRCGIFAASSVNHTRTETGATYFGIMNMSGNLRELAVYLLSEAGLSFTGLHGDGLINSSGDATTDHWPGMGGNNDLNTANGTYDGVTGVTSAGGMMTRGGSYSPHVRYGEISNREIHYTNNITNHNAGHVGRLVRTTP